MSSSSSSSNIVVRLPLVFSTTNDDVVKASCSVIREHKREKRDISKTLSSLSRPTKKRKKRRKRSMWQSLLSSDKVCLCVSHSVHI